MITVRTPNGQAIQYNTGWYIETSATHHTIKTEGDKRHLAVIPLDCIIEWMPACRVYNPLQDSHDGELAREIRKLQRQVRRLKKGGGK